jgi:diguanylate cyclase (GGDEF)-like protein/PAS domain S-box-containing protein
VTTPTLKPLCVLAIEDDPGDFGLIRAHIRLSGLCAKDEKEPVIWAKTLASGVIAAQKMKPDIILLDLSLPDSAGMDTVHSMRSAQPNVPIVVLTGHDDYALANAALQAGAQDYLVKGNFDHDALGRAIRYALARNQLEFRLRLSEVALNAVANGIVITDQHAQIEWVNPAFTHLTGYTREEAIGKKPGELVKSGHHSDTFYEDMWQSILSGQTWSAEMVNRRKDGTQYDESLHITPVISENGTILHFVAIMQDITERKRSDVTIRNLAFYDALTKLPNRRLLNEHLNRAIASSRRNNRYSALIFLDLDNFKPLNDTYGHVVGDQLLIEAATRLKDCLREIDTASRFGGDEFIVLLSELSEDEAESAVHASMVAEKIRNTLSAPYLLELAPRADTPARHIEHHCTASIGVVVFSGQLTTAESAIMQADTAMYQAKERGRNLVVFHQK